MDKDILSTEIDLNQKNKGEVNEVFLRMFGGWVKTLLSAIFGGNNYPFKVKGTKDQIKAFAGLLNKEKNYMQSFMKNGLENPRTYSSKASLDSAVTKFERQTGIKWPFK